MSFSRSSSTSAPQFQEIEHLAPLLSKEEKEILQTYKATFEQYAARVSAINRVTQEALDRYFTSYSVTCEKILSGLATRQIDPMRSDNFPLASVLEADNKSLDEFQTTCLSSLEASIETQKQQRRGLIDLIQEEAKLAQKTLYQQFERETEAQAARHSRIRQEMIARQEVHVGIMGELQKQVNLWVIPAQPRFQQSNKKWR